MQQILMEESLIFLCGMPQHRNCNTILEESENGLYVNGIGITDHVGGVNLINKTSILVEVC